MTNRKEILKTQKQQIAKLFNSKCYVCSRPFGKCFTFHHMRYHPDEKTYRDFKSNLDYQLYILPIVKSRPQDFALLCGKHHHVVEILKRFKVERFNKLIRLVKLSR